jgi:hypothetical protein
MPAAAGPLLQQHQLAPCRVLQTEATLALLLLLVSWASQAGGCLLLCLKASGLPTMTNMAAAQ